MRDSKIIMDYELENKLKVGRIEIPVKYKGNKCLIIRDGLLKIEISSYVGISCNAEHYYCKLHTSMAYLHEKDCSMSVPDEFMMEDLVRYTINITKVLNAKEAKYMTKKNSYLGFPYKKGDRTECFDSVEEAVKYVKEFIDNKLEGDFLFTYDGVYRKSVTQKLKEVLGENKYKGGNYEY